MKVLTSTDPPNDRILGFWSSNDDKYLIVVNTILPEDLDQKMHKYTCSVKTEEGTYQFDGKVSRELLNDAPQQFIDYAIEVADRKISEL